DLQSLTKRAQQAALVVEDWLRVQVRGGHRVGVGACGVHGLDTAHTHRHIVTHTHTRAPRRTRSGYGTQTHGHTHAPRQLSATHTEQIPSHKHGPPPLPPPPQPHTPT